jgi:hypothetical protein
MQLLMAHCMMLHSAVVIRSWQQGVSEWVGCVCEGGGGAAVDMGDGAL